MLGIVFIIPSFLIKIYHVQEYNYYKNTDNFIEVTGVLGDYYIRDEHDWLFLHFEETSFQFIDTSFILDGENYNVVMDKNIIEVLEPNTVVQFVTAPGYFGDGWHYPIVAIEINGITYLEFEEGYENLLDKYR